MICEFQEESTAKLWHLQGLLWRFTEEISENKNIDLINGFYARLDYVSFASQEISFSSSQCRNTNLNRNFILLNFVANHFLNISCTLADAGAVGAILWSFEFREISSELAEEISGARFHSAFSGSFAWGGSQSIIFVISLGIEILELLSFSVLFLRVGRSRLAQNFVINSNFMISSGTTGILACATGVSDGELTEFGTLSSLFFKTFVGGVSADSQTRHFVRVRQGCFWLLQLSIKNLK